MQDLWFCFVFRGEKIKVDFKLKLNVGAENSADIKLNGEATKAAKEFFTNGYLAALNGMMEFCDDEECNRMKICGTDLCNTFEPKKNWIEQRVGFITEFWNFVMTRIVTEWRFVEHFCVINQIKTELSTELVSEKVPITLEPPYLPCSQK